MQNLLNIYRPWRPVFEGEDDTTYTKADVDAAVSKATEGLLSEDDLTTKINEAVTQATGKVKETNQSLINEIEVLQKKTNLTKEDREKLSVRIEELENQLLTKEELAEKEQRKIEKKHTTALTDATERGDKWKKLYTSTQKDNAIIAAAQEHKGYSAEQFLAILRPMARLSEEVGKDGPTGNYITKIAFKDQDKAGKEITLDLSPTDAVKRMKEIPKYQNLFAAKGKSGLDMFAKKAPGDVDIRELAKDTVAYRQAKKDGLIP